MRQFTDITRALGDETRLRLLMALERDELCVCHLVELAGLAPSTVSRHLAVLRQAGLIRTRRRGRWIYCSRAGADAPAAIRNTYLYLQHCLALRPEIRADRERLAEIVAKMVPA